MFLDFSHSSPPTFLRRIYYKAMNLAPMAVGTKSKNMFLISIKLSCLNENNENLSREVSKLNSYSQLQLWQIASG